MDLANQLGINDLPEDLKQSIVSKLSVLLENAEASANPLASLDVFTTQHNREGYERVSSQLEALCDRIGVNCVLHRELFEHYKMVYFWLGFFPLAAISALTSVTSGTSIFENMKGKDSMIAIFGTLSGILAAISAFWNWQGRAEKHLSASKAFESLNSKVMIALEEVHARQGDMKFALAKVSEVINLNAEILKDAPPFTAQAAFRKENMVAQMDTWRADNRRDAEQRARYQQQESTARAVDEGAALLEAKVDRCIAIMDSPINRPPPMVRPYEETVYRVHPEVAVAHVPPASEPPPLPLGVPGNVPWGEPQVA